MTELAEPEHVETAQPSAAKRGGQWVGRMLFAILLVMALLGAAGYWFGWPWAQQTSALRPWNPSSVRSSKKRRRRPPRSPKSPAPRRTGKSGMPWRLRSQVAASACGGSARGNAERAESTRQISNRMTRVEDQVDRLLADRRAWLGREAIFLIRLAGQRLLVARDVDAALSLLGWRMNYYGTLANQDSRVREAGNCAPALRSLQFQA